MAGPPAAPPADAPADAPADIAQPPNSQEAPAGDQDPQNDSSPGSSSSPEDAARLAELRGRGKGQYGCKHYRRRVRFITPCCNEEWWCRHCHNEAKYQQEQDWEKKHELDRKSIRQVSCALCETVQPVAEYCSACGVAFGEYACTVCPFYDDCLSREPYHCAACGICRVGGRGNYFHCDTCCSCYSISLRDNHKCVERAMHQNCPVCFEFLFESVDPTTVLRCGHTIHTQCLRDLEQAQTGICPACPICKKSLGDYSRYWRAIDAQVAVTPVPAEYAGWRADLLCNDCSESANVPFHIIGLRCPGCGSYNTRRMGLHTGGGAPVGGALGGGPGGGTAEAGGALGSLAGGAGSEDAAARVAHNLLQALFGMQPEAPAGSGDGPGGSGSEGDGAFEDAEEGGAGQQWQQEEEPGGGPPPP